MSTLSGRFWPILAGLSVALFVGCQQPPQQKGALGNLPAPLPNRDQPKVNATTYFAHGHLLERQGRFERAAVQYRRALELQPEFLSALNRLGITLNKLGRHAEATQLFQQALLEHPATPYLQNNLGFSLYLEGEYVEAEVALKAALELKPEFARAHMNYALVLARLGRFDETFDELLQACSEADACFNAGILLTEAEEYAQAASYLEQALAVRPDFEAARQQLHEVARLAAEQEARQLALAAESGVAGEDADSTEEFATDSTTDEVLPTPADADVSEETDEYEPWDAVVAGPPAEDVETESLVMLVPVEGLEEGAPEVPEEEFVAPPAEAETLEASEIDASDPLASEESEAEEFAGPVMWDLMEMIWLDSAGLGDDAAAEESTEVPAEPEAEQPEFAQEPGIDTDLLFAMINEAVTALREKHAEAFDALCCKISYYLFPETAPAPPEPEDEQRLADQRDIVETTADQPVGK